MKVKHYIFAWTMLVVLLTHSFGINVLYGLYNWDQDLFVELFCVNQDKPELECDGSCMLSKLDHQQTQDQTPTFYDFAQYQLTYITHDTDFQLNHPVLNDMVEHQSYYHFSYKSLFSKDVFRPPILV